jgi:hypothetical protein
VLQACYGNPPTSYDTCPCHLTGLATPTQQHMLLQGACKVAGRVALGSVGPGWAAPSLRNA